MNAEEHDADNPEKCPVLGEKILEHSPPPITIRCNKAQFFRSEGETHQKMQRKDDVKLAELENPSSERLEALLLQTAKGSQRDFKMLVEAFSPKIHGVLLAMLRDREMARDALQVVFARVWLRAASYEAGRGSAEGWMIGIARNHAIDLLRAQKRRAEVQPEEFDDIADAAPSAERRLTVRDDVRKMLDCLGKIEPKKAGAVRMAYLQGMSYTELAERTGIPLNTVRTWLRRGLAALKACVDG